MSAFKPIRQELTMVIDLDERGWFQAHVENQNGKTIFQFSNEDEETGWPSEDGLWIVEDGFMRHGRDTDGLLAYAMNPDVVSLAMSEAYPQDMIIVPEGQWELPAGAFGDSTGPT